MSQKTTKKQNSEKSLNELERRALIEDLKRFGYLLPTNDEELDVFNSIFGTTKIMLPQHLRTPDFINSNDSSSAGSLRPVKKIDSPGNNKKKIAIAPVKKITANAFFKKLVLAAEITSQLYNEYTFGHVKFVKIQFLCDQVSNMDLESNYGKFAAGPLDPIIHTIDGQFKKRKWFSVTLTKYGYKYTPDINANEYKKYYSRYFGNVQDKIDYVINLFRKENSEFCEVIATLFAVWKEHLENNKSITDEELSNSFYSWSPEKKKFETKFVIDAINWMKTKELVPSI